MKPFKVTTTQDGQFNGIAATSLQELKMKCHSTFISKNQDFDSVRVMLHEDRTVIEDEDYFTTLSVNTKLIITHPQLQMMKLQHVANVGIDTTDSGPRNKDCSSMIDNKEVNSDSAVLPPHITQKLSGKNASDSLPVLVGMSTEELEVFVDCDVDTIRRELGMEPEVVEAFIDGGVAELERRHELSRATELMKLYEMARQKVSQGGGDGKRKRTAEN